MTDTQPANFQGYAIVEIMGHQRCSGYVETVAFGSVVMFKVTQAELPPQERILEHGQHVNCEYVPGGSKVRMSRERAETYIGAASIYRMTPCTEEEAVKSQPVNIEVIEKAGRLLPTGVDEAIAFGDDLDEDDDDQDGFDDDDVYDPVEAASRELRDPQPAEVEPLAACAACSALAPGSYCREHEPF